MCVAPRRRVVGAPRRWAGAASCAIATTLLLGCAGDSGAPDRSDVERALVEREALSTAEAACVADFVTDGYDAEALEVLVDEGVGALPSPLWAEYVISMVSCTLGDELTGPTEDDEG